MDHVLLSLDHFTVDFGRTRGFALEWTRVGPIKGRPVELGWRYHTMSPTLADDSKVEPCICGDGSGRMIRAQTALEFYTTLYKVMNLTFAIVASCVWILLDPTTIWFPSPAPVNLGRVMRPKVPSSSLYRMIILMHTDKKGNHLTPLSS